MINRYPPSQVVRRLASISTAILEANDYHEACEVAARSLDELLTCDKALVVLLRSDNRLMLCSSRSDRITDYQQTIDGDSFLRAIMYSPESLPLTSSELDALGSSPLLAGVRTTLSHPLRFKGMTFGALLAIRHAPDAWTELEESVIAWMASEVAQPVLHHRTFIEYREVTLAHLQAVERITAYHFMDLSMPAAQAAAYRDADVAQAFPFLTQRQRQVLVRLDKSNAEIAADLGIQESSVKGQVTNVHKALGVSTRQEALVVLRSAIHHPGT